MTTYFAVSALIDRHEIIDGIEKMNETTIKPQKLNKLKWTKTSGKHKSRAGGKNISDKMLNCQKMLCWNVYKNIWEEKYQHRHKNMFGFFFAIFAMKYCDWNEFMDSLPWIRFATFWIGYEENRLIDAVWYNVPFVGIAFDALCCKLLKYTEKSITQQNWPILQTIDISERE